MSWAIMEIIVGDHRSCHLGIIAVVVPRQIINQAVLRPKEGVIEVEFQVTKFKRRARRSFYHSINVDFLSSNGQVLVQKVTIDKP